MGHIRDNLVEKQIDSVDRSIQSIDLIDCINRINQFNQCFCFRTVRETLYLYGRMESFWC